MLCTKLPNKVSIKWIRSPCEIKFSCVNVFRNMPPVPFRCNFNKFIYVFLFGCTINMIFNRRFNLTIDVRVTPHIDIWRIFGIRFPTKVKLIFINRLNYYPICSIRSQCCNNVIDILDLCRTGNCIFNRRHYLSWVILITKLIDIRFFSCIWVPRIIKVFNF